MKTLYKNGSSAINLNGSDRFLYIEWNSEGHGGGGGIGHVCHTIGKLIRFYLTEKTIRSVIFSPLWRFDWERHSPNSNYNFVDMRDYYNIGDFTGKNVEGVSMPVYFDENEQFKNEFITNKKIGIVMSDTRIGFSKLKENNKNVELVHHDDFLKVANLECVFFGGTWIKADINANQPVVKLHDRLFTTVADSLKQTAQSVVERLTNKDKNPFYVIWLRRGDRLHQPEISKPSEIPFVVNTALSRIPKRSTIYIMTNGTDEYVNELACQLCVHYTVFTKNSFKDLKELGNSDNFKLFLVETFMSHKAAAVFSNRFKKNSPPNRSAPLYSLQQIWRENQETGQ